MGAFAGSRRGLQPRRRSMIRWRLPAMVGPASTRSHVRLPYAKIGARP